VRRQKEVTCHAGRASKARMRVAWWLCGAHSKEIHPRWEETERAKETAPIHAGGTPESRENAASLGEEIVATFQSRVGFFRPMVPIYWLLGNLCKWAEAKRFAAESRKCIRRRGKSIWVGMDGPCDAACGSRDRTTLVKVPCHTVNRSNTLPFDVASFLGSILTPLPRNPSTCQNWKPQPEFRRMVVTRIRLGKESSLVKLIIRFRKPPVRKESVRCRSAVFQCAEN